MIELLPLTAAEREFLARGAPVHGLPSPQLTRTLALRLAARLGMAVAVHGTGTANAREHVDVPCWRRDSRLDSLWLARRLGGRQARGLAAPEQPGLTRALDQALAERLLDDAGDLALASESNWRVCWDGEGVELALTLPAERGGLQRWALEVIRDAR